MDKIIYREESYDTVGCCFEVFNELGPGHREKTYQLALEKVLTSRKIPFISQQYIPVKVNGQFVDKHYIDMVVFGKIAIELKTKDHLHKRDIDQLYSYLMSSKLKLGILINFTSNGVVCRRVLNCN
jgi:GxxExxY protein